MQFSHKIAGGDFSRAGHAASSVKRVLRELNIDPIVSKHVVIGLYEAEVNVVAHAWSGTVDVDIDGTRVKITITDKGPGIEDIERAMEEGYSTASAEVREMGFGAGLGLSNMKKNSDSFVIESIPGEGTKVELVNYLGRHKVPSSIKNTLKAGRTATSYGSNKTGI
jgi:anti-sigma regulatory factor (Ser/Thr protein kinase)